MQPQRMMSLSQQMGTCALVFSLGINLFKNKLERIFIMPSLNNKQTKHVK